MTTEQRPLIDNPDPLRILEGRNFVVAETYIIRRPINFSDKTAKENVSTRLSSQGVTGTIAVTFCNSEEERIREIFRSLKLQKSLSINDDPEMIIAGFNADQLQKMFEIISIMITENEKKQENEKDQSLESIDANNVTILQLNAQHPINDGRARSNAPIADPRTGVRLIALGREAREYPARSSSAPSAH